MLQKVVIVEHLVLLHHIHVALNKLTCQSCRLLQCEVSLRRSILFIVWQVVYDLGHDLGLQRQPPQVAFEGCLVCTLVILRVRVLGEASIDELLIAVCECRFAIIDDHYEPSAIALIVHPRVVK